MLHQPTHKNPLYRDLLYTDKRKTRNGPKRKKPDCTFHYKTPRTHSSAILHFSQQGKTIDEKNFSIGIIFL